MSERFDASEIERLKYYVYIYTDPRTDEPFYVGKGKGNRAFTHLDEQSEHEKVLRIKEIQAAGFEPRIELLAHGLDEVTAYKVEAAAIDLVGPERLTNRQGGHGSREYGRQSIDTVHARLSSTPLVRIPHPVLIIRIDGSLREAQERLGKRFDGASDESALALYDATRGMWWMNVERAGAYRIVLAANHGIVREVYQVAEWFRAGTTKYLDGREAWPADGRWEFVGRVADEAVRKVYRHRSVAHLFPRGDRQPVRYFDPGEYPAL
ncbi:MAG: hypothetical protein J7480_08505 [Microbacteriaceae bacterium]|nr:hypothetical protein [Microbacteriaceae bacterium]